MPLRHSLPRIRVLSRQQAVGIDCAAVRLFTLFCLARARHAGQPRTWAEVAVTVTDARGMACVKKRCFGREEDTDVVALAYAPVPGEGPGWMAEIFVNAERARCSAPCGRWSTAREFALYLAHGCDHLGGACDRTRSEQMRMRRRELRWIREADRLHPIEQLVRSRETRRKGRA
jgi:ssRNA-specific RNase YbeY (16S rRNA maturation enzyme)